MTAITPAQCRAARALLDWSQTTLAVKAKREQKMVTHFETGKNAGPALPFQKVLEAAGILFIPGGAIDLQAVTLEFIRGQRLDGATLYQINDHLSQFADRPVAHTLSQEFINNLFQGGQISKTPMRRKPVQGYEAPVYIAGSWSDHMVRTEKPAIKDSINLQTEPKEKESL